MRLLGGDPAHPGALIELRAPVSGTIVEQNISGFEGIKSLDNSPNLFTIADLSQVWVLCDVYENDLGEVHVGDAAEIRLNAYPDRMFRRSSCRHFARPRSELRARPKCASCWRITTGRCVPECLPWPRSGRARSQSRIVVPATANHAAARQGLGVPQRRATQQFRRVEVHTPAESLTECNRSSQKDGFKPEMKS